MKRLVPFIVIALSVVLFAAFGPDVGENTADQYGLLNPAAPVSVAPLH